MTLTTYRALECDAIQRYERLYAICPAGTEIVYIISRSVRDMMLSAAGAVEITTQFHNGAGIFGVYQGTRILMAEDVFPRSAFGQDFFAPAVVTDHYIQGMEIGDLIIGPNNRVFYLTQVVMNADGTVTSRFEELADVIAGVDCAELATSIDAETINYAVMEEAMEAVREMCQNSPYAMAPSVAPASSMSITYRPQKEESMTLGDTSALDEFLNSFARTGFLQAAT